MCFPPRPTPLCVPAGPCICLRVCASAQLHQPWRVQTRSLIKWVGPSFVYSLYLSHSLYIRGRTGRLRVGSIWPWGQEHDVIWLRKRLHIYILCLHKKKEIKIIVAATIKTRSVTFSEKNNYKAEFGENLMRICTQTPTSSPEYDLHKNSLWECVWIMAGSSSLT